MIECTLRRCVHPRIESIQCPRLVPVWSIPSKASVPMRRCRSERRGWFRLVFIATAPAQFQPTPIAIARDIPSDTCTYQAATAGAARPNRLSDRPQNEAAIRNEFTAGRERCLVRCNEQNVLGNLFRSRLSRNRVGVHRNKVFARCFVTRQGPRPSARRPLARAPGVHARMTDGDSRHPPHDTSVSRRVRRSAGAAF